jgi:hypothetical protein
MEAQRARIAAICSRSEWVLDSAYSDWRDIPLATADLESGSTFPGWASLERLVRRTATRVLTRAHVQRQPRAGQGAEFDGFHRRVAPQVVRAQAAANAAVASQISGSAGRAVPLAQGGGRVARWSRTRRLGPPPTYPARHGYEDVADGRRPVPLRAVSVAASSGRALGCLTRQPWPTRRTGGQDAGRSRQWAGEFPNAAGADTPTQNLLWRD